MTTSKLAAVTASDKHEGPMPAGFGANESPLAMLAALAAFVSLDSDGALSKDDIRDLAKRDPLNSLLATVLGGGLLFHLAEKDHNPRCTTLYDSILYVATSLAVGFDDVVPKTKVGHLVGAAVHTFGPALAAQAFNPPLRPSPGTTLSHEQEAVLLEALKILAESNASKREPASAEAEASSTALQDGAATNELVEVNRQILSRLEEIADSLKNR